MMIAGWEIIYYTAKNSRVSPIYTFIDGLTPQAQAKVINTMNLLEEFGVFLKEPHSKKIKGTKLWELRILGSSSIRVLYSYLPNRKCVLLHAFKKKRQKLANNDLNLARERLNLYIANITKL